MNLTFLTSGKLFYVLIAAIVMIVLVGLVFLFGNLGGGGGAISQAKLEFWGVYEDRKSFSKVIEAFQNSNPANQNIKINYRQFSYADYEKAIVEALAAGVGPDLVMIHHTWLAKHKDKLAPMPSSSGIEEINFLTLADYQMQLVDVAYKDLVSGNKIYGVPLYVDTLALYYNKDMFNTAGITRPPQSWEEFNKDVESLTKFDEKGNIIQAGAAIGTTKNINRSTDILGALMLQNGTKMTNVTNTAAVFTRSVNGQKVGENALQYYIDFANPKKTVYAWNESQKYSIDAFIEGKVAMMFNYSHQIPVVRGRYERLNFAVAPMPQFSELDAKNYANYWAVGVLAKSKNQQAAWRFVNFLASKGGSLAYVTEAERPSARRDIIDMQRNDPRLGIFAVQALSARSWYQIDNIAIEQIFADMIDDVNFKRSKISAALRAAESKISTLMTRRPY